MGIASVSLGLAVSAMLCFAHGAIAQTLYKHVGKDGKVYYTDRPQEGDQKKLKLPPPNVQSPEASQQLRNELNERSREESAERAAQLRRAYALQDKERREKAAALEKYYQDNPGERPLPPGERPRRVPPSAVR
jgi:hypothetical protein